MKADKAPEKIYITPHFERRWFTKEIDDVSVEYTRTDVLIEKACNFLSEKCDLYNYEEFNPENRTYYINYDKIVDDFRKYIKGA